MNEFSNFLRRFDLQQSLSTAPFSLLAILFKLFCLLIALGIGAAVIYLAGLRLEHQRPPSFHGSRVRASLFA